MTDTPTTIPTPAKRVADILDAAMPALVAARIYYQWRGTGAGSSPLHVSARTTGNSREVIILPTAAALSKHRRADHLVAGWTVMAWVNGVVVAEWRSLEDDRAVGAALHAVSAMVDAALIDQRARADATADAAAVVAGLLTIDGMAIRDEARNAFATTGGGGAA